MRFPLRTLLVAALAGMAAACERSSSGSEPDPLTLEVVGTLARDSVVRVRVLVDDAALPPSEVTLTAGPADAAQLLGGDSLRLLKSGTLVLSAAYRKQRGSRSFEVAAPHPLAIETAGRLERGSVIRLRVLRDGAALPAGATALAFAPADGAQALGGDSVKLLRSGTVAVRASAPGAEGVRELTVAVPPAVVFDRVADSNRDLWRVELDGGNLTRLTDDPAADSDPSVAAGQIAFVSLREGNAEIFRMPLPGGAASRVTRTAAGESMPALAPNGQRLAYVSNAAGVEKLWLAASDGSGAAPASATGDRFSIDAAPSWDGLSARLVFSSTAEGTPDIFLLTPTGTATLLAGGSGSDVDPAFSRDNQFVAFASTRGGGGAANLYLVTVATGAVTRLTTSPATHAQPAWTTDGRIVFTEFGSDGAGRLRWIDPASPSVIHQIGTGAGSARNPSAIH